MGQNLQFSEEKGRREREKRVEGWEWEEKREMPAVWMSNE